VAGSTGKAPAPGKLPKLYRQNSEGSFADPKVVSVIAARAQIIEVQSSIRQLKGQSEASPTPHKSKFSDPALAAILASKAKVIDLDEDETIEAEASTQPMHLNNRSESSIKSDHSRKNEGTAEAIKQHPWAQRRPSDSGASNGVAEKPERQGYDRSVADPKVASNIAAKAKIIEVQSSIRNLKPRFGSEPESIVPRWKKQQSEAKILDPKLERLLNARAAVIENDEKGITTQVSTQDDGTKTDHGSTEVTTQPSIPGSLGGTSRPMMIQKSKSSAAFSDKKLARIIASRAAAIDCDEAHDVEDQARRERENTSSERRRSKKEEKVMKKRMGSVRKNLDQKEGAETQFKDGKLANILADRAIAAEPSHAKSAKTIQLAKLEAQRDEKRERMLELLQQWKAIELEMKETGKELAQLEDDIDTVEQDIELEDDAVKQNGLVAT
jgi:hypothetical protein